MIAMFSSFYIRTYRRNADAAASAKQAKDENGQRVKKVD